MKDIPEIVRILREEEKQKTCQNYNINENILEETEHDSLLIEDDEKQNKISDYDNTTFYKDETELKKELDQWKKKYYELKEKLKESEDKFKSLAEYFEVLSNTTIALGKKDLFSDVNDIIFQLTPSGRVTYVNSAIESIAGYSPEDILGSSFSKIIPKSDWKKVQQEFFSKVGSKDLMQREINSFETCVIHKTGSLIPVEINGKLINHGFEVIGRKDNIRIQGSIRDISERKKNEEERLRDAERLKEMNKELSFAQHELKKLNEELEQKVKDRTIEIEKLLRHKDEFIGQLSHDLKSPLTPLVGLLPFAEAQEKDPDLKEILQIANRNVKFMKDLVVKTLQLENLNSPNLKLNSENLNLSSVIDKLIIDKEYLIIEKDIKVRNKIDKKIEIFFDKLHFNELIDNLFTNAIKFTPKGGIITFESIIEKGNIIISIKDSGIGLSKEQIGHIFEEFYKADPARHDLESSGLGLSICKRIVERHGGQIWVESKGLEKGSTFYFSVPINSNIISNKENQ